MGWVLDPWCHGRGYASEAVAAAIAWGEATLDAREYVCIINPDNAPSLKLAARFAFAHAADASYKGGPISLFRRPLQG